MDRSVLIGKEICHVKHGKGIIKGFRTLSCGEVADVCFYEGIGNRSIAVKEGLLSDELVKKDFELKQLINIVFFGKPKCRLCHGSFVYDSDWQKYNREHGLGIPTICPTCRLRWDVLKAKEIDRKEKEIRSLMGHLTSKKTTKRRPHDTDGMSVYFD